jgi:hypothetical protein
MCCPLHPTAALEPRRTTSTSSPVAPSLPPTLQHLPLLAALVTPPLLQIHSRSARGCVPSRRFPDDPSLDASLSRPQAGEYYQITPGREWRARRPNPAFPRSGPSTDLAFLFVHPGRSPLDGRAPCLPCDGLRPPTDREHTRVSTAGPNFDHPILEGDLPDWAFNAFDEFAADTRESESFTDASNPPPAQGKHFEEVRACVSCPFI